MLLRVPSLPGEVWGHTEVGGEDCRIICSGGEVSGTLSRLIQSYQDLKQFPKVTAHSAILAGASPFLASLLCSPPACHCTSTRSIHLPGVGVTDVQALVQLLCTGQAPLPSTAPAPPTAPLVRLLSLADVLGLSLTGLTARTSQGRVIHIQEQSKGNRPTCSSERSQTPPLPDSQRFRRNSQQQDLIKVRQTAGRDGLPRRSKVFTEQGDVHARAQENFGQMQEQSKERTHSLKPVERKSSEGQRQGKKSQESDPGNAPAKPSLLQNRWTKLPSSVQNSQHSSHFAFLRPRSPNSPPPGPQARVVMSDTALIDLMDIKKEVVDDEVVAELEGREMEMSDEGEEEEYPDMDNYGRNYVCCKCAKGFTFAKSFNWHTSRCQGAESRGRGTENSLGKREGAAQKMSDGGDLEAKKKLILGKEKKEPNSMHKPPLRQRSVTPQSKERTVISKEDRSKKRAPDKRERSVTPRGKVTLSKIQLAGPSPRKKELVKKIQLEKKGRNNSSSPPEKKKKSRESSPRYPPAKKSRQKLEAHRKASVRSNRSQGGIIRKKIDLAKKVVLKKSQTEVAAGVGRPARGSCGRCVKCKLPDCGKCAACVGGNTVQGLRGCARKVCRNKGRRSVRGST